MEQTTQPAEGSQLPSALMNNERFARIALHIAQVALYLLQGTDALYAEVQPLAASFIEKAKASGYSVNIISTFRTFDYQNKLYAQGRTTDGQEVTNAQGGQSYHNYGLAFDFEPAKDDGNQITQDDWTALAQIGTDLGLVSGGSFGDYDHLEWHPDFTWNDLINVFSRADDAQ